MSLADKKALFVVLLLSVVLLFNSVQGMPNSGNYRGRTHSLSVTKESLSGYDPLRPIPNAQNLELYFKCGPCEMKYQLCGLEGQVPVQGPYSDFVEDGVTIHCNNRTGYSVRYQCAYECNQLEYGPSKLACTGCQQPVAYIESLGKECTDVRNRYYSGLKVVDNDWYAAFWDNLATTCQNQLKCTCTPASKIQYVTYLGKVATLYKYDIGSLEDPKYNGDK